MTKETNPEKKGFLVEGTIPELPRVPVINAVSIWDEASERGNELARMRENESNLVAEIDRIIAPWGPRLFAMATKRLEHGEYEPKKRRKKEKTSKWRGDGRNGFGQYTLEFRTKRRDREVDGVDSFRMDKNGSSVTIELKDGQITEVNFKYDTSIRQFWEEAPSLDWSTPWGKWIDDVVIDRGIRTKVWEKRSNGNGPRVMDKLTFNTATGSLRYAAVYDPNRGFAVYFGGRPPVEPLVEIGDEYRFNAGRNRFNHLYDETSRTREELESELVDISDPTVRDSLLQHALKYSLPKYPLFTPDEFTAGLGLLLDTIPLAGSAGL